MTKHARNTRRAGLTATLASLCLLPIGCFADGNRARDLLAHNPFSRLLPTAPELAPDTVIVQYIPIERPVGDPLVADGIWRQADEQFLPPKLKEDLLKNGLRVGKLSDQLGSEMLALLEKNTGKKEGRSHQTVAGNPLKVQLTDVLPRVHLFSFSQDVPKGENLENAQGYLQILPNLAAAGKVHMSMLPIIEFGERMRIPTATANLAGLEIRSERPARNFTDMRVEADLESGEYLIIGCLPDRHGMAGSVLLSRDQRGTPMQTLLLVRAIRPSTEDLFQAGYESDDFFLSPQPGAAKRSTARDTVAASKRLAASNG